jgi:hypothetical protein
MATDPNNTNDQDRQRLEEELRKVREELAAVKAERDQYRRLIYPAVWQKFTEEELRHFSEDDSEEGVRELDQFVGELEEIVADEPPP